MSEEITKIKDAIVEDVATKVKVAKQEAIDESAKELVAKEAEILGKVTKSEDFEAFKAAIGKQVDEMDLKMQKNVKEKTKGVVSMTQALTEAFEEESVAKTIKSIANGGKQTEPIRIEVAKAAVDLTTANTIGAGATQVTITQNTGIVSTIRQRVEKYLANVSVGSIGTNRALWVEENDEQGNPIFIAEGAAKTQLSVKFVEKTKEVQKVAVYGKVTTEMMGDTPQLISYIQNNLVKRVSVATENQLLSGDNTGENLSGLKTYATSFSAGSLAGTINNANEFDVLEAVRLQVEIANGMANAIFVHPASLAAMKLVKDTTGVPLWKSYADNQGNITYGGMQLITSTGVPVGEFFGGDLSVVNVLFRDGLSVQIGLDGNDFINNKKTILVEQRLVQFVSANDTPVLVKGVFATAKAALETA